MPGFASKYGFTEENGFLAKYGFTPENGFDDLEDGNTPTLHPPAITSLLTAEGETETEFDYQITASNNPTSYGATGLPGGLTVDTVTGEIYGTPEEDGEFAVTISATNADGTGQATLVLTVEVGIAEMLNAEKLSLPVDTAIATPVSVTDGFLDQDGLFWPPSGQTWNGKPTWIVGGRAYFYDSTEWNNGDYENGAYSGDVPADPGNEDYPWLATWTGITLTHPALQQLQAPGGGALLVSGDTSGTYTKIGTWNSRDSYGLVGQTSELGGAYNIYYGDHPEDPITIWGITGAGGALLYYSTSDTPTPLTATGWKNASDDSPASIVIALTDPQGGVFVAGGTQDGVYRKQDSTNNGRALYNFLGATEDNGTGAPDQNAIAWDGVDRWQIWDTSGDPLYYSLSDVATPDLAGTDKVVMVYDGVVYTKRGLKNSKPYYNKLGEADDYGILSIVWGGGVWSVRNEFGADIDTSSDDTATPDLAAFSSALTNVAWLDAHDDSPAVGLTVTSVSVGQLAAGFKKQGDTLDTYAVSGNENGRNKYTDVLDAGKTVSWDNTSWKTQSGGDVNLGNVAFPFLGTPEVTVTRSDVAAEANWGPIVQP